MNYIAEKLAIVKLTLGKLLALFACIYMLESLVIGLISLTKWYLFFEEISLSLSLLQRQDNLLGSALHCTAQLCFGFSCGVCHFIVYCS